MWVKQKTQKKTQKKHKKECSSLLLKARTIQENKYCTREEKEKNSGGRVLRRSLKQHTHKRSTKC